MAHYIGGEPPGILSHPKINWSSSVAKTVLVENHLVNADTVEGAFVMLVVVGVIVCSYIVLIVVSV